jgi:hypothetical protein
MTSALDIVLVHVFRGCRAPDGRYLALHGQFGTLHALPAADALQLVDRGFAEPAVGQSFGSLRRERERQRNEREAAEVAA